MLALHGHVAAFLIMRINARAFGYLKVKNG